jgi:hypothetical protein
MIVRDFQNSIMPEEIPPTVQALIAQRKKVLGDNRVAKGSVYEVINNRFNKKIEAEYARLNQARDAQETK